MICVVGGIKGGSGKTTVTTNLAVMRASGIPGGLTSPVRHDVLLIDADDQETSSDFTQLRTDQLGSAGYTCIRLSGGAVRTETMKLKHKYEDILIDTGGRDTTSQRAALTVADLLLVPFVPRSFDLWTLEKMVELVGEMRPANTGLTVCTFLNRADPRGVDNGEAAEQLKEACAKLEALHFCAFQLGTRKAFGNAASLGLAVTELKPPDEKASHEIAALYHYVFDIALKVGPSQSHKTAEVAA